MQFQLVFKLRVRPSCLIDEHYNYILTNTSYDVNIVILEGFMCSDFLELTDLQNKIAPFHDC